MGNPSIGLEADVYAYPSPTMPPLVLTPRLLRFVHDNGRERSSCLQLEYYYGCHAEQMPIEFGYFLKFEMLIVIHTSFEFEWWAISVL